MEGLLVRGTEVLNLTLLLSVRKCLDFLETLGADDWAFGLACYHITTGDIEDAPAPNGLIKFDVFEKDGAVYVKGDEASIKASGRTPVTTCSIESDEHVVIVGR
jgi:hypothetical protein